MAIPPADALPGRPGARVTAPRPSRWPPSGERLTIRIARGPTRDSEPVKRSILADPGILEEGLRLLDAHLRAGDGELIDLLALDAQDGFVLIEIQREEGEDLLARITRHREWVASQCAFLRRLYGAGSINPLKLPRAIVLSEGFDAGFLEALRAAAPGILTLRYRILTASGRRLLHLEPAEEAEGDAASATSAPLQLRVPERDASNAAPVEPAVQGFPDPQPERLTVEELEAFYGFERRRLAAERERERVKA